MNEIELRTLIKGKIIICNSIEETVECLNLLEAEFNIPHFSNQKFSVEDFRKLEEFIHLNVSDDSIDNIRITRRLLSISEADRKFRSVSYKDEIKPASKLNLIREWLYKDE